MHLETAMGQCGSVMSTWIHFGSLWVPWVHLHSLVLTWVPLGSLGFMWVDDAGSSKRENSSNSSPISGIPGMSSSPLHCSQARERTREVTKSGTMPCNSWHCNATVLGSTVLCFIVKRVDMTRGPALQIGFSCPSYIRMHIYLTDRVKQGCSTNNVVSDSFTYYWFSLNHRNSIVLRILELAMKIKC